MRRSATLVSLSFAGVSAATAQACPQFGEAFALVDDLDGDGWPEILVADRHADENRGRVYLFDGESGELVRAFVAEGGGLAGSALVWLGGERHAFATLAQVARRIDLFDAVSGEQIGSRSIEDGLPEEGVGRIRMDLAGDVDGDGASDLLLHGTAEGGHGWYGFLASRDERLQDVQRVELVAGDPAFYRVPRWSTELDEALVCLLTHPPRLEVRELLTGEVRATLLVDTGDDWREFGAQRVLAPLGDLDEDGTVDLALSLACGDGRLRAISGSSGATLWERGPDELCMLLGNSILAFGDPLGGPEAGGLLVAGYEAFNECLLVVSGVDGAERWRSSYVGTYMGWELAAVPGAGERPALLFGSLHSPFGMSPDRVACFELGSAEPRFVLADPYEWMEERRLPRAAVELTTGSPQRLYVDERGPAIALAGDLDGDGLADLLLAERSSPPYRSGPPGRVRAVSTRDGATLHEWRPERPCELHGAAVSNAGNLDGDAVPDVWIGAEDEPFDDADDGGRRRTRAGLVLAYSGDDGRLLRRLESPDDALRFGVALAGGEDLDGDGTPDLLVGAPARALDMDGRVYVYSGASGELLATLTGGEDDDPPGARQRFGHALAFLPDLDGDGVVDFAVGLPMGSVPGEPGRVELYSGATRALLRGIEASRPIGWAVGVTDDLDDDGLADLWTTSLGDALLICSSARGDTLITVELPGATEGSHAALVPDLDGDGARDLAIATLGSAATVRVVSCRSGELIATLPGGPAGVDLGVGYDIDGAPALAVLRRGHFDMELVRSSTLREAARSRSEGSR